jgi:hypothetical protein
MAKPTTTRRDRLATDIEYERQCDECTFQPVIHTGRTDNPAEKSVWVNEREQGKAIERMRQARVMKEFMRSMADDGYTFNAGLKIVQERRKSNELTSALNRSGSASKLKGNAVNVGEVQEFALGQQAKRTDANQQYWKQRMDSVQSRSNAIARSKSTIVKEKVVPGPARPHQPALEEDDHTRRRQQQLAQYQQRNGWNNQQSAEKEGTTTIETIIEDIQVPLEKPGEELARLLMRKPLLCVDVNVDSEKMERIIVFEGDRPDDLAAKFAELHGKSFGVNPFVMLS